MHDIRLPHGLGDGVDVPSEKVIDLRIYIRVQELSGRVQELTERIETHGCVSGRPLTAFTSALLKQSLLHLTDERFRAYLEQPSVNLVRVIDHVPVLPLHPAQALSESHLRHEAWIKRPFRQVVQYGQVVLAALLVFLLVSTSECFHEAGGVRPLNSSPL
jgi:hypothetical protein